MKTFSWYISNVHMFYIFEIFELDSMRKNSIDNIKIHTFLYYEIIKQFCLYYQISLIINSEISDVC